MRSASSSAESSSIFALYSKCMYPFLGVHVTLGNRLELLQQLGLPTRQSVIAMVVMTVSSVGIQIFASSCCCPNSACFAMPLLCNEKLTGLLCVRTWRKDDSGHPRVVDRR